MTNGVIYVAIGPDYLDLAQVSLASLRRHNPDIEADLFTDELDAPGLDSFDQVHPVPIIHPRAKIHAMPQSRFDRTLCLDCDTLILAPFLDLFDVLDGFDLALAHEVRRNMALVKEGHDHITPYAFPQHNSGVMLYRKSPRMMTFFEQWQTRYHEAGKARDQITLKDLLWSSDLRYYVLPPEFNLRRLTLLDAWEPLDCRPTILHSHRLMDHMQGRGPRIQEVQDLLDAERQALHDEWMALGLDEGERLHIENLLARFLSRDVEN